ncbi:hypothetical protein N0B51_11040 [Tsuneonella sp. YG55]|uniref:Uncharacterized protein n=1 Tax=Tsuneonella litorea TaxID=2976475 RepID=A0A9X2W2Q3_9SPHN|nr:hypothetical protein [Tsuneonella litorea]MCT2559513.1 hypothetical protein [Tsuneonella litorea]
MDLKSFVSETLTQIVTGVEDARNRLKEINPGARINPEWTTSENPDHRHASPTPVEFDVAVVVVDERGNTSGEKLSASAGILSVVTAKMSAEAQSGATGSQRNETVSRVKFSVNVAQPADLKHSPPSY